jgi:protein-S-isoprenylcysteine O-methyltransferase Ste14
MLAEVPRVLLPLPFVSQPRLQAGRPVLAAVGVVLAGSLLFATPVVRIVAFTGPARREPLRTEELHSVVRHPLCCAASSGAWLVAYLRIDHRRRAHLAVPAGGLGLAQVEEESLVREYGVAYREFQSRVPRLRKCGRADRTAVVPAPGPQRASS